MTDATPSVVFTRVTLPIGDRATKQFVLDKDGVLHKASAPALYRGECELVDLPLRRLLDGMASHVCHVYGACAEEVGARRRLVTASQEDRWPGAVARTREHFRFLAGRPGVLFLDHDPRERAIPPIPALDEAALMAALVAVFPGFADAARLVAGSALGAVSTAGQALIDVARADRLTGPVSIDPLTIADSGERKSTVDAFFTRAIRNYQAGKMEELAPALAEHAAALAAWEAKRTGAKDAIRQAAKQGKPASLPEATLRELERDKPRAPKVPRLLFEDTTAEALAYRLATGWPSAGIMSSEAGTVLGSHGMGKDSIVRNLSLLNVLRDGGSLTVDRKTTESFTLRGARLTVSLLIQEATLRGFFDRSDGLARGTGFFARFLLAWPESTQGTRFFTEPPASWPALERFHRRLSEILEIPPRFDESGVLRPTLLEFTPEAKAAWIGFHDAIEAELRSGGELFDVRDVASKSADNAARLDDWLRTHLRREGAGDNQSPNSAPRRKKNPHPV